MRGDLTITPVATCLRELGAGHAEGVLDLDGPGGRGVVVWRGGRVVAAGSPRPRRRLGARLIAAGQLDDTALSAVLRSQSAGAPRRRLGALLVDHGLVPPDAVRRAAAAQVVAAIRDLLAWDHGTYRFAATRLAEVDEVAVRLEVDELLVAADPPQRG